MSAFTHMKIEQLVDEAQHAEPGVAAAYKELRTRLKTLRSMVAGDQGAIDTVLNGQPLTFTQLLDKVMEEMEAAGVADANSRSVEDAENEPHRNAAYNYRAMLEERFELLQAQNNRSARVMDGN